jgi:hypothetical protein
MKGFWRSLLKIVLKYDQVGADAATLLTEWGVKEGEMDEQAIFKSCAGSARVAVQPRGGNDHVTC